ISSFLLDPEGQHLLRSTIESKHDAWLVIARHVASLLRHECVPPTMRIMASLLMSLEFWIKDISVECQEALPNVTRDKLLPPLCMPDEHSCRHISYFDISYGYVSPTTTIRMLLDSKFSQLS
ncbi:hypothetical protein BDR06DRAFT_978221, partial [Suillus hirtellus]